ncbi:hypothetical protein GMI70_06540 [Eggerthellaceae bacterium zg-893]|nr:hypothetical protein [Eggerthellaceae bacterium zg-893]
MGSLAWGDESIRVGATPPMYLLAATIIDPEERLDDLKEVKPRNAEKLHWRDMTYQLQTKSLKVLTEVNHDTIIVAGGPLPKKKQERARRKCLERLLLELQAFEVGKLVLESRNDKKNKEDIELLLSMRRKKLARSIDISHEEAGKEPRLWIPDQILGAYGDVLCDGQGVNRWRGYWDQVSKSIRIVRIGLI